MFAVCRANPPDVCIKRFEVLSALGMQVFGKLCLPAGRLGLE